MEAIFKFRASGDIDVSSLTYDYSSSQFVGWCHAPYVVKIPDDYDNLYELRFELDPYISTSSLERICVVSGPIYVIPDFETVVTTVSLTIKQKPCLENNNCEELLSKISVFINGDTDTLDYNGGAIEVIRNGFSDYFIESYKVVCGENEVCSWASCDSNGNVVMPARGYDSGQNVRECTVIYSYTYSSNESIDNPKCHGEFEQTLYQTPKTCDDVDFSIVKNIDGVSCDGGKIYLKDIISISGVDFNAFELTNVITTAGPFLEPSVVYSESAGYIINISSNYTLENKIGYILLTYKNKYLQDCIIQEEIPVIVSGVSCDYVSSMTDFYLVNNATGEKYDFNTQITINGLETYLDVVINGEYAEYFYLSLVDSVIDPRCTLDENTLYIPENNDSESKQIYNNTFVFKTYLTGSSISDCIATFSLTINQDIYEEIEELGIILDEDDTECDSIEQINLIDISYSEECNNNVDVITSDELDDEQHCDSNS